jgi:hypothetical protein
MNRSLGVLSSLVLALVHMMLAQDAREIIRRSDELARGTSCRGEMTMKVIKPEWSREYSMKFWSFGTQYSLVYVSAPARDKGTVTLKRKSEVWNYIPNIDRTIKIPSSMMMQSWMGSDFTNDDLVKQSSILVDYTQTLEGDSVVDGMACYRIILMPRTGAAVVWGKIVAFVSKVGYYQILSRFFDEEGVPVRIMHASGIKNLGNRALPSMLEMTPLNDPGNATVFQYHEAFFDEPMQEGFFSQQNMKTLR